MEPMSTNSRLDVSFCGGLDSRMGSWAEDMSIYSKLGHEFGWMVGQKVRN